MKNEMNILEMSTGPPGGQGGPQSLTDIPGEPASS
eukprot:CAMPEP_0194578016 /NCGR_PEP_ID=MMETSP0292-20121207/12582_1 /TAXON_ID=39354 /ORGANISM="Heterosigma akashiwo, Strain CCMP2393" /LENGTH=34 /DNA_ID= /DNA_START= /DNA_END= /DNA_ORIENTATION=